MFEKFFVRMTRKEHIESKQHNPPFFKERDIWWCAVGENVGTEVCGKGKNFSRPVLVLKRLSRRNFFGLPMTTKSKKEVDMCQLRLSVSLCL